MKMKTYYCKTCKSRNIKFGGTRQQVRKHIREYHLIKGKRKAFGLDTKYLPSVITKQIEGIEI